MSDAIPETLLEQLSHQSSQVIGFIYPNEVETQWAILIVVYPYLTGIVAGAFILASLVKVFNVVEVQPIYRLALLTALAFMLVAGMPLQLHLGHPERAWEIFVTPQPTSAMAMFGFVYLWYLLGILLIEIWFEYRHQLILMAQKSRGLMKGIYGALWDAPRPARETEPLFVRLSTCRPSRDCDRGRRAVPSSLPAAR